MEGVIRRVIAPPGGAVAAAGLIAVGLLLASCATDPPPGKPESQEGAYTIGQFNMAGGTTEHGAKGHVAPDALAADVQDREPAFVSLQETCRDWTERLEERLPGYTVLFSPVDNLARNPGSPARCHHPTDFGNGLVLRDDVGFDEDDPDVHRLGSTSGDEYREMVCVRSQSRKAVACSAHLTPGRGEYLASRKRETAKVRRVLASEYPGHSVLLGGDINDLPLSGVLGGLYHRDYGGGARGGLKEAASPCGDEVGREHRTAQVPRDRYEPCRSGEPTHSKGKIDYLFVSPSVQVKWSRVTYAEHSDHKQVWAGVVL